jgi:hypothetical protein
MARDIALELPPLPETSPGSWQLWRAETPPHKLFIIGRTGRSLAMLFDRGDIPAWENGLLMAEAPAMRDALVALLCAPSEAAFGRAVDDGRAILRRLSENRS